MSSSHEWISEAENLLNSKRVAAWTLVVHFNSAGVDFYKSKCPPAPVCWKFYLQRVLCGILQLSYIAVENLAVLYTGHYPFSFGVFPTHAPTHTPVHARLDVLSWLFRLELLYLLLLRLWVLLLLLLHWLLLRLW